MSYKTTDVNVKKISNGWLLTLSVNCGGHALFREMYDDDICALAKLTEAVMVAGWAGMSPETVRAEFSQLCKTFGVSE